MTIDDLIDNFSFLSDWEDKYRYLIELGDSMEPFDESEKTDNMDWIMFGKGIQFALSKIKSNLKEV